MGKDRFVLVTGASGGLGEVISRRLNEEGYSVIALVRKAPSKTPTYWSNVLEADFLDLESVEKATTEVCSIAPLGLHALVNCAGLAYHSGVRELIGDEVYKTFMVNSVSPIMMVGRLIPYLKKRNGILVMVTSRLVSGNLPFTSSYSASKKAIDSFACSVRIETGLRVLCVEPGAIETEFLSRTHNKQAVSHFCNRQITRLRPERVAKMIVNAIQADPTELVERIQIVPSEQIF